MTAPQVGRRQLRLGATLLLVSAAALALAPAAMAYRPGPQPRAYPHRRPALRTQRSIEEKRTPQAAMWQASAPAVSPALVADWIGSLLPRSSAKSKAPVQQLAVQEAGKLLMAVGSAVGAAGLSADVGGLTYVADTIDVLDAQALITEGQAAAASLWQDQGLINLKLALQDGTERIITLLSAE
eukprot:CAMPEP_0195108308 /NCGR_PEP_ID=MMETSP0448-20130528/84638_1 /TAXON_ID=66468 /ORGANISM="Heterocapsa triquestra, Strain CCMP 448" /LENGTH=182 /DNA_ID=CAMNT_0040144829 /DNA_START=39 /DNA_END=587 /DNA_ORIENTATION=+